MNALEELVHNVVMALRELFNSDDPEAVEEVLSQTAKEAERAAQLAAMVSRAAKIAKNNTATIQRIQSAEFQEKIALQIAARIAAKLAQDRPAKIALIKRAIVKRSIHPPILNGYRTGPPGWLGRLVQWGQLFQAQYFTYCFENFQYSWVRRVNDYAKKSGPDFWDRQTTKMRGSKWGWKYAEPAPAIEHDDVYLVPVTDGDADTVDVVRQPEFFSPFRILEPRKYRARTSQGHWHDIEIPPEMPRDAIRRYIGILRGEWDFSDWTTPKGLVRSQFVDMSASLFSPLAIAYLFPKRQYPLQPGDPALLANKDLCSRSANWMSNARWLVWAAETWRANTDESISHEVISKWVAHVNGWAVGFTSDERVRSRRLFGQDLQTQSGKAGAKLQDAADASFNAELLLKLVMDHTPFPWSISYADMTGSLCDWDDTVSGTFRPLPWAPEGDRWISRVQAHGRAEPMPAFYAGMIRVAKIAVEVVKAVGSGGANIGEAGDEIAAEVIKEAGRELAKQGLEIGFEELDKRFNLSFWGELVSALGRIANSFEVTDLQDSFGNIWGLYDRFQQELEDKAFDVFTTEAQNAMKVLEHRVKGIKERYPFAADLLDGVIATPEQGFELDAVLRNARQ